MLVFEFPPRLLFLTLLAPAIYFCHIYRGRGGVFPAVFGVWGSGNFRPSNIPARMLLFISTAAFWLGTAGLVVALAGPSRVEKEKIYISRGIDIMFVLDESPSMAAMDFPPGNRFDASKEVIRKFVDSREHDPVGLVTFAREAALRIPPTLDYGYFTRETDRLELMELGNGTALGLGIAIAALHMQESSADRKIIILITDGENNAGEIVPDSAAGIAAEMGIRIYTVGIGSRGEVPIEYTDRETGKIITGQYMSDFDEILLRQISEKTGGKYYYAPSTNALNSIISLIDSLETSEQRVKIKTSATPLFRELILFSLILVLFDFVVRKILMREVL